MAGNEKNQTPNLDRRLTVIGPIGMLNQHHAMESLQPAIHR